MKHEPLIFANILVMSKMSNSYTAQETQAAMNQTCMATIYIYIYMNHKITADGLGPTNNNTLKWDV